MIHITFFICFTDNNQSKSCSIKSCSSYPILYCSAHFQHSPGFIHIIHSVYHIPFTFSIRCHLRPQALKTIHFRYRFAQYHMHSTHIYIPRPPHNFTHTTFILNFLLYHIQPNSLASLHNFSYKSPL